MLDSRFLFSVVLFIGTSLFCGVTVAQPGGGPGSTKICGGCFQMDDPISCGAQEPLTAVCPTSVCVYTMKNGVTQLSCMQPFQTAYLQDNAIGTVRNTNQQEIGQSCFDYVQKSCTQRYACDCSSGMAYSPCVTDLLNPTASPTTYRSYFLDGVTCQD